MYQTYLDSDRGQNPHGGAWLYIDELMHRTLNDYTVLLAIVRRTSSRISERALNEELDDMAFHLRAAATTYRVLGPPRDDTSRSLDLELTALSEALNRSILARRPVTLSIASQPITVSARRCWQVSLIVAELITNAARHAFGRKGGSIYIDLRLSGGSIQCSVRDDGVSPAIVSPGRGSAIVDALAAELGGRVVRSFGSAGSTVILQLPASEPGVRV